MVIKETYLDNISKDVITLTKGDSIEVKRFYLPGKIHFICKTCGAIIYYNFEKQYLSYPIIGEQDYVIFMCDDCDSEFEVPIVLEKVAFQFKVEREKAKKY